MQDRYRNLLQVSRAIFERQEVGTLVRDLYRALPSVVECDFLALLLADGGERIRVVALETEEHVESLPSEGFLMAESPSGWAWQHQEPLLLTDIPNEIRWPLVTNVLRTHSVWAACYLPLSTPRQNVGVLGFGRKEHRPYDDEELEFMQQVAGQVAVALENALAHEAAEKYRSAVAHERDRLKVVLEVTNAVIAHLDAKDLFSSILSSLRRVIDPDYASLALLRPETNELYVQALDFPRQSEALHENMTIPESPTPAWEACRLQKPVIVDRSGFERFSSSIAGVLAAEGVQSAGCFPLVVRGRSLGTLNLGSRAPDLFSAENVQLLTQVANQVAIAIDNSLTYGKLHELQQRLSQEKLYLEEEIRTDYDFQEIIGESAPIKRILHQIETVAPTPATVLILGETGTGKELIARAIHNRSARRQRTFVRLNCAAIPSGLLESEIFGHEKGAFTGAITQKIGRMELADEGSLFLDEVGDIPLELQPKLLRALQEQEFERLGSTRTIHVDVRLIAATNRDLEAMVGRREFRSDLFYRLKVFPILVPPLRERRQDIPLLVRYFTQKHARRMGRQIESIPTRTMEELTAYHWPGNIRELENLIERAVILSRGTALAVPLAELQASGPVPAPRIEDNGGSGTKTLEEVERDYILRVLRDTRWRLAGPGGAAERLGLKRTTLQSRMKKLGLERPV